MTSAQPVTNHSRSRFHDGHVVVGGLTSILSRVYVVWAAEHIARTSSAATHNSLACLLSATSCWMSPLINIICIVVVRFLLAWVCLCTEQAPFINRSILCRFFYSLMDFFISSVWSTFSTDAGQSDFIIYVPIGRRCRVDCLRTNDLRFQTDRCIQWQPFQWRRRDLFDKFHQKRNRR